MSIKSKHPAYASRRLQWERCRDAFDGQDAVKGKGRKYLPMLTKQKLPDYHAYKDRALFFSITGKTVSALVGLAMLRPPMLTHPVEMSAYFKDDQGIQFYELLATVLSENLLMGRIGVMLDRPVSGGKVDILKYYAENIINWEPDDHGRLQWVVLEECVAVTGQDRFEKKYETRYRLLELTPAGTYQVSVYNGAGDPITTPVIPTNQGSAMDNIPFFVLTPYGLSLEVVRPPMLEIVDINLSHYRTSADLEHGRHFTALPTAVVTGASSSSELYVGSPTAWVIPEVGAKAMFLEFTGQGLGSLEKALEEKQGQLASMSARLLDTSRKGSEAAETVRLRYASETASLAMVVRATEALMNKVYATIAEMEGLDPTSVRVQLNKEFLDARISAKEVLEYVQSYIDGGISEETLIYNLRRGDAIDVNRSDAEEIAALKVMKQARQAAMLAKQQSQLFTN